MITLKIDEEVQGYKKELDSCAKVLEELDGLLDESVYEVTVKKRAAINSSKKGCSRCYGS